jgi:hypothetical protein
VRVLEGPYAVFPTQVLTLPPAPRLRMRHVMLRNEDTSSTPWFDLDPLMTFAVCPKCQRDDVFFFESVAGSHSFDFRSFISGHRRTESIPSDTV